MPADGAVSSDHIINESDDSLHNDDTSLHEHIKEHHAQLDDCKMSNNVQTLSTKSGESDLCLVRNNGISDSGVAKSTGDNSLKFPGASKASKSMEADSDLQIPSEILDTLPPEEHNAVNRVLDTIKQRLVAANADREVLLAKLNQEVSVKQYLTTKVCP